MSLSRGHRKEWLIVRCALEGIPSRAIARIIEPTDAPGFVDLVLADALRKGLLDRMPPDDWPAGSRVTNRSPARDPFDTSEIADLALDFASYFMMQPAQARLLAALMLCGRLDSPTLKLVTRQKANSPDILKIQAHRLRRRLARPDIDATFQTIFFCSYFVNTENRAKITEALTRAKGIGATASLPKKGGDEDEGLVRAGAAASGG